MNCPNCGAHISDGSSSCPNCGQPVLHPREIVEAELVDDDRNSSGANTDSSYGSGRNGTGRGPVFSRVVFTSGNGLNGVLPSCQTGFITMVLAFAAGFKYGALAFIGFLVFYGIAKAVTLAFNFQSLMVGRAVNPLLLQVISWFCCWGLVALLAS